MRPLWFMSWRRKFIKNMPIKWRKLNYSMNINFSLMRGDRCFIWEETAALCDAFCEVKIISRLISEERRGGTVNTLCSLCSVASKSDSLFWVVGGSVANNPVIFHVSFSHINWTFPDVLLGNKQCKEMIRFLRRGSFSNKFLVSESDARFWTHGAFGQSWSGEQLFLVQDILTSQRSGGRQRLSNGTKIGGETNDSTWCVLLETNVATRVCLFLVFAVFKQ